RANSSIMKYIQRAQNAFSSATSQDRRSGGGAIGALRIEQPVQMHDEIAHMGVVDGLLRLRAPRRKGGGVIGIDADEVELVQILELGAVELRELAAEHEMQQLLGPRHCKPLA